MLLFDMKWKDHQWKGEDIEVHKIHLETLIKFFPKLWQKSWVESMQINEKMVKETDILEILFNIIERFCQMIEDEEKIIVSFDTYIDETHDKYHIIDWNVVLHHVQVGKAYSVRPY